MCSIPVANAIKLLQACFYKSVNTGLFLTSLVATGIVKYMLLIFDSLSIWYLIWLQMTLKIALYYRLVNIVMLKL